MTEEQKEFRREQSFLVEQLSRISNLSINGNQKLFYGLAGRILKQFHFNFAVKVLSDISQKEYIQGMFENLIFGILKKEYYKTHDPCLESLDRIGKDE